MGSIEQQWLELVCQSLGWTLIHFLWQGGAVAVILAALMHLLKQASAQTRYGVAGMALLVMVVAPILTLTVMIDPATTEMPMPQTPSANLRETQSELPPAAPHIAGDPPFSSNVTVEQVDLAGALSRQGGMIETLETCLPWLVLLWLIGVLGLSIWHVGAWIQLQRFRRSVTDGVNASTKAMVDALAHRIGIRRSIRLCESARVCVPSVIGWLKPMILLPVSGLSGLSVEQMEAILAHELAHIRRHDYFVNLLQTAVEILGFYHPAVWWVSHTMRIERELCCDDIAVQATGHRRVYAEALAQLEAGRGQPGLLALAATDGQLTQRITRLIKRPAPGKSMPGWVSGLVVLLALVAVLFPVVLVSVTSAQHEAEDDSITESTAWTVMRQLNSPPLLLGLTQQFAKILDPKRLGDPAWQSDHTGASLTLRVEVENALEGGILIGLFKEATWRNEPVAVRRLSGPGLHQLEGLPRGRFQVAAMMGTPLVPLALGVQKQWPQPVTLEKGGHTEAQVLISEAFQARAAGEWNSDVASHYLGQWRDMESDNLLQGQLKDPKGAPIPFGMILVREYNPGARSFAAPNLGTSEKGLFRYDGMSWPYRLYAEWRESLPSVYGMRQQQVFFNQVLEGPKTVDFEFKPFPTGTASVKGRVVDQKGQPVRGFFMRVRWGTRDEQNHLYENPDGHSHSTYSIKIPFLSKDGSFELKGLAAGHVTVNPLPFENGRYEREWGKEVELREGQVTEVLHELQGKQVFYGRVLFEDGSPGVMMPSPWRGAKTTIFLPTGRRSRGLAQVDQKGEFTIFLDGSEVESLQSGSKHLRINLPSHRERRSIGAGEYPFDQLSQDKSTAGDVRISRPDPPVTLPPELRSGAPLPPGWRLEYQEHRRRLRNSRAAILDIVPEMSEGAEADAAFSLDMYTLKGMPSERIAVRDGRTMTIIQQSDVFLATLTPKDNSDPTQMDPSAGPYLLDLSRPGRYTLTLVKPALEGEGEVDISDTVPPGRLREFDVVSKLGQAVVGAEVYVCMQADMRQEANARILARGRTDDVGKYRFVLPKTREKEISYAIVIVRADGGRFGFGRFVDGDLRPSKIVVDSESAPVKLRMIDRDGEPIQGIRMRVVSITHHPAFMGDPPLMPGDFWNAMTDADGRCVIDQVPKGMAIYVDHDDPRFSQVPGRHAAIKFGRTPGSAEDEIRLLPASVIRGRVMLADGQPVPNVIVTALEHYHYVQGGASSAALTDREGRFQLSRLLPASYDLRVSPGEALKGDWVADLRAVTLDEGQVLEDQDLHLAKGVLVTGRVMIADDGEGLEGIMIGGTTVDKSSPLHQWWAETDANGVYMMRLPLGRRKVYFGQGSAPEGLMMPERKEVDVVAWDANPVMIDFPLKRLRGADMVSGIVLSASGEPVAEAVVRFANTWWDWLPAAVTNEAGEFQMTYPKTRKSTKTRGNFSCFLYAEHAGGVSPLVGVKREDHVTLQLIEEDQLANFQGRVMDESGNPVKGASIQWGHSELMNDFWFRRMALSDAQGRFEFKGLLANEPVYFSVYNDTRFSARHPVVQANVGETVILSDMVVPLENSKP